METVERCQHNDEHECFDCTTARHAAAHPEYVDGCLMCKTASVRIYGRFIGTASTSKGMDYFWETGDPSVFDAQERRAAGAREERKTRIG